MMRETWVSAAPLVEQHRIKWKRPIAEYFAVRPPKAYEAEVTQAAQPAGENAWRLELDPERGTTLTFALPEQWVGWPGITIEAPAGTTLEMMTQDGHAVGGPALAIGEPVGLRLPVRLSPCTPTAARRRSRWRGFIATIRTARGR